MSHLDLSEEEKDWAEEKLFERSSFHECWEWLGALNHGGYGVFSIKNPSGKWKQWRVHRAAWVINYGPLTEGLTVDHTCRNRKCWRPTHLEEVTCKENLDRSPNTWNTINSRKKECKNGHAFSVENTFIEKGYRQCLTCRRTRDRINARQRRMKRSSANFSRSATSPAMS